MNQHRYKASFSAAVSGHEFFNSSVWLNYGFWAMLVVSLLMHGIMYFHPDTGFAHYDDLNIIYFNAIGLAVFFVLKLFAHNIYIVGKFISVLSWLTSLSIFCYMCYLTYTAHFPIAFIGGVMYFGVAGFLLNKDYVALKESAI